MGFLGYLVPCGLVWHRFWWVLGSVVWLLGWALCVGGFCVCRLPVMVVAVIGFPGCLDCGLCDMVLVGLGVVVAWLLRWFECVRILSRAFADGFAVVCMVVGALRVL